MNLTSLKWDGNKISVPGLYANVPMNAYHGDLCAGISVSSTGLRKIIHQSPADYYDGAYFNPARAPESDNENFILGRAVHHLLLGEKFFSKLFVMRPATYTDGKTGEEKPWNGNSSKCKEWLAEQEGTGRDILLPTWIEQIKGMVTSVGQNELVRHGLLNGLIERSIIWKDKETGIWLKIRPDSIPTDSGDAGDVKTTASVTWQSLSRSIDDYAYYQQAALVRSGFREVLKLDLTSFTFLFVKKTRPYSVRPIILKDHDLDLGERCNTVALRIMWQCLRDKRWPGPGGDRDVAEYLELSDYARGRIENRLAQLEPEAWPHNDDDHHD